MSEFELTPQGKSHFRALCVFAKHMLSSEDIDPLYPVMRELQRGMNREQALWHSFLYVAWYNLPSATAAFDLCPEPDERILNLIDKTWPTGTERRANRGGKVIPHIADYLKKINENQGMQEPVYYNGLVHHIGDTLEKRNDNWRVINANVRSIYMNGRWAGYKHLEILRRVNGSNLLEAPDAGHQFSTGPREGLHMLYGELEGEGKKAIETLDEMTLDLQRRFEDRGIPMDIEHVETILCNYKSLAKGKYAAGHDIDELQDQIEIAYKRGIISKRQRAKLYDAREEALPHHYLGELCGWQGVDKERNKHFVRTGKIIIRKPKARRHICTGCEEVFEV